MRGTRSYVDARTARNGRMWRPALQKADLDKVGYRFHDLRHCTVSRLVA